MVGKIQNWLKKNEGLVLILLLTIGLRIPSLFEPYWYGDENIYLVLGQALKKGLVFYRDIHDNKPPLLYLLAAISGSVFYFRLLLMVWFGVTIIVFYKLMEKFFPEKDFSKYLAVLLMIGLTTIFEGNIANAEIFIILPVITGMLMAINKKCFFGIGWLMAIGFLFKVPALFDFGALLIWLILVEEKKLKNSIKLIAGFLLPVGLSIAYYWRVGGLEPYVRSALMQNIGYLNSWSTGNHTNTSLMSQIGLIKRGLVTAVGLGIFTVAGIKFKFSRLEKLSFIWFLMALFGALLSGRPYPHYLIQVAAPLAILLTNLVAKTQQPVKVFAGISLVIFGWYYWQIRFWHYPLLPYYKNYWQYLTKQKSLEAYRNYFDPKMEQNYQISQYIKTRTKPDDRIFVWADEPGIYALAERLPVGRYTVAYHIIDFNGFEETIKAWDKNPPKIVVLMEYQTRSFPEMTARLNAEYLLTAKIGQAQIYKHIKFK
mgnify:CR=1 FL=1